MYTITDQATVTTTTSTTTAETRGDTLTRSLLMGGAVAGPLYVVVSLAQALTRDGFDLAHHQWSLLLNGDLGWIQVTNFIVTGILIAAFAVGLRRVLRPGIAGTWAPRLIAVFGASMVAAGIFKADPALGFPAGTPDGPGVVTTAGILHFAAAGVGFIAVAVACFVVARRLTRDGERRLARLSRITGIAFLAGFLCVASGAGSAIANVLFTVSVVSVFAWMTVLAAHHHSTVRSIC